MEIEIDSALGLLPQSHYLARTRNKRAVVVKLTEWLHHQAFMMHPDHRVPVLRAWIEIAAKAAWQRNWKTIHLTSILGNLCVRNRTYPFEWISLASGKVLESQITLKSLKGNQ